MNQMNFVRQTLYGLKRQYGKPIEVYAVQSTPDLVTGRQTVTRIVYRVARAIVLPELLARKFDYDRLFLANSSLATGATWENGETSIFLDCKDLPPDFPIVLEGFVVIRNERWKISSITRFEHDAAYLLVVKKVTGQLPYSVIEVRATSQLEFQQEVLNEP